MQLIPGIIEIIKRVQCPRRDTETATLWAEKKAAMDSASYAADNKPTAFCKALEFTFGRVNAMRMDAANARLRLIAPVVRDHGVEYARGKMREKIKSGAVTLNGTRAWLKESMRRLVGDQATLIGDVAQGNAASLIIAHGSALVDLIENKSLAIPETLKFDANRINTMRTKYEWLVFYSVVLVTVKHCRQVRNVGASAEAVVVAGLVAAGAEADQY
jgi:hypothetical protein